MSPPPRTVTRLIRRLTDGDGSAADDLWPIVYEELRSLASAQMAGAGRRVTLQPTALVHEAWMRFCDLEDLRLEEGAQFFLLSSKIMRSVLVDTARARNAEKRGGGREPAVLSVEIAGEAGQDLDVLALDDALEKLADRDATLARLVELRFFSGLDHRETAEALGQSVRTVERNWHLARVWLHAELSR